MIHMHNNAEDVRARFAELAESFIGHDGVTLGEKGKKGFGSGALQVRGKIFARATASGEFVVKLPKNRVDELEGAGVGCRFESGGRAMKEWLSVSPEADADWRALASEALRFVGGAS